MKKALEYLNYVTEIFNAITKGVKTVIDHWPSHNPFSSPGQKTDEPPK